MDTSKLEVKHQLFGCEWSYWDLKQFDTVKTYHKSNHDIRALLKAPNGMLFLYDFHEEMGFPNDIMNEFFFVVESEEQADKSSTSMLRNLKEDLKRWIHIPPNWDVRVIN